MKQITDTVLMIRPACFSFNEETAANNYFQKPPVDSTHLQQQALKQFDDMVDLLRKKGIQVIVIEDTPAPAKPDAVFPNNWFCAANGRLTVFPMFAATRRPEKRQDILQQLEDRFQVTTIEDWSHFEEASKFLEGTGSMVMDHEARVVYACRSPRTDPELVRQFAAEIGYRPVLFRALDKDGRPIYHTNVMMCIGEGFAVLCPTAISDPEERRTIAGFLETSGHENVYITPEQMAAFAGNMLHLKNDRGERFIVLSKAAFQTLEKNQLKKLELYGELLPIDVSVIEETEGGSVRCMMAEIFLEPRN